MAKKVSATGNVYSLNRIEDFAGHYASIARSVMAGTTTATATYKNDKGVSIDLRSDGGNDCLS
jgi:SH3-like domain-containing protein